MSTLVILLGLFLVGECRHLREQYHLIHELLGSYDTDILPMINDSVPIRTELGLSLFQILELVERTQTLKVKVWMTMIWTDSNLRWNPSDYGNISAIRLTQDRIWQPDIKLYTDLGSPEDNPSNFQANVDHKGIVELKAPLIMTISCEIEVSNFPWDEQRCPFTFVSWTFDSSKINLMPKGHAGDISSFIGSGQWNVIAFPAKVVNRTYPCCDYPFNELTFTLVIRRKPLYFLFNLVLPAVFITILTLLVFFLPPESGEKISLAITALLALTVFLLIVADILPATSDTVPLIGQYFAATIVLLSLSTALTAVVLDIHHKGRFIFNVPYIVRLLVLDWLARLLLLKGLIDDNISSSYHRPSVLKIYEPKKPVRSVPETTNPVLEKTNERILKVLAEFYDDNRDAKREEAQAQDWRLVAMVVDRLLLFLFLFLTVGMTVIILNSSPTYSDSV